MSNRTYLHAIFITVVLTACGSPNADVNGDADAATDDALHLHGPNDLELVGTGFLPHAGQRLFGRVSDGTTYSNIGDTRVGADGNFVLRMNQTFNTGNYHIAYFADINGDHMAEAPPVDHSWIVPFDGNQRLVTLHVVHDPNAMVGVGGEFGDRALTLDGNFLDTSVHHGGQTVYAAAIDIQSKLAVVVGHAVVDPNTGLFTIAWPRPLLDAHHYFLAYFADVDADGLCDNQDHRWLTPDFQTSNRGNTIDVVHRLPDATDMGACTYFTGLMLQTPTAGTTSGGSTGGTSGGTTSGGTGGTGGTTGGTSTGGTTGTVNGMACPTYAGFAQNFFTTTCSKCHNATSGTDRPNFQDLPTVLSHIDDNGAEKGIKSNIDSGAMPDGGPRVTGTTLTTIDAWMDPNCRK